ncbi:MAG: hypothetical protein PVG19_06635 [Desulfobacterales bacterium]|jgi:hypothetical protein
MTDLTPIGSQAVQRVVPFRARPDAPLRAAIEEAVNAEQIRTRHKIAPVFSASALGQTCREELLKEAA